MKKCVCGIGVEVGVAGVGKRRKSEWQEKQGGGMQS